MLVLLEGNIAAGKTTLGQRLAAHPLYHFVPEPVARWQTGFAANLLERFYHDTPRWAFTMQVGAFVTRAQTFDDLGQAEDRIAVFERSIFCDRHVFARNLHAQGLMDDTEWALYEHFWDYMARVVPLPDAILYLRTPAEVCYQRLQARGRAEEKGITPDYLHQLEQHHDDWLLNRDRAEAPVLVLDGTQAWDAAAVQQRLAGIGVQAAPSAARKQAAGR